MKLKIDPHSIPLDLENTLLCGQLFRWEKQNDWWYGIVKHQAFKVQQVNNTLEFEGANVDFVRKYFRLDDNLPQIISEITLDSVIKQAIQAYFGLRIVRQNPWECLISYICATYKNIPAIKNMISELSKRFGEEITFQNHDFYAFPEPATLAKASVNALRSCKLGFRAKLVQETARMVSQGKIDLGVLKRIEYKTAKNELMQLPGVGNKVADCVLLFSLEKLQAFPVDVWMKRVVQKHYAHHFDASFVQTLAEKTSLSPKEYNKISDFAQEYFGRYAGYAQEYLFHYVRSDPP